MQYISIPVATIKTEKGFTVTKHYETASWYTLIDVLPGEYEVRALCEKTHDGQKLIIKWIVYELIGTVIEDYFPSSFGGLNYGTYDKYQNKGKPETMTIQTYDYMFAGAIAEGRKDNVTLLPGWRIENTPYISSDGQSRDLWGLQREENDIL